MAPLSTFMVAAATLSGLLQVAATEAATTGPMLSSYFPAYTKGATVAWNQTKLAMYFVDITTKDGFEIGPNQPLDGIKKFTSQAYAKLFRSPCFPRTLRLEYHQLAELDGAKPMVTLGSWNGSLYFSKQLSTPEGRTKLASQLQNYLYYKEFKGVDISWLYPVKQGIGCNTVSRKDTDDFLEFLKTLRGWLGTGYLISIAVPPNGFLTGNGTEHVHDYSEWARVLDHINIMTYDYAGPWSPKTGPLSPMHSCASGGGVAAAVKYWTSSGFPAKKILISIPSYAISFTLKSSKLETTYMTDGDGGTSNYSSLIYQSWSSIPKGEAADSNEPTTDGCGVVTANYTGHWHYTSLIKEGLLAHDGSTGLKGYMRYMDGCSQTPFLFNPTNKHFIAYEDATSASIKAGFARDNGLKGVTVFTSEGFDDTVYDAIVAELNRPKKEPESGGATGKSDTPQAQAGGKAPKSSTPPPSSKQPQDMSKKASHGAGILGKMNLRARSFGPRYGAKNYHQ
ncbi:BZ3500_MvSof-1268-A1-R1_Chr1-2g01407 [Microbotryum saponariae]|uniref:BZ3500_MvSof-1268-A1-R1_Chr1-2g01407 protein n=1 Tax=Microbotryum saponariae TaxID=289078 RepID=A0A2X0LM97_9BASI|nr:BZ3500_MvSof-1268-A1-R1_Chr1-2g01407 [Microbotryum saponariae]SCZ97343.1 BZ3501_MvSof-1269-A2-R1_Chr1-2g01006 [Microbotryum saponariae]